MQNWVATRFFDCAETESAAMAQRKFRLSARISSDNPSAIRSILEGIVSGKGTVKPIEEGFEVEAVLEGVSARDLNRVLLSEMRKAEKRTRLRAEWTYGNLVERFFDYVSKGTRKLDQESN